MNVSEQEVRGQIAQMREAIRSVRTSQRIASAVRTVAVLVGIGFVVVYLYVAYTNRVKPLLDSRAWTPVLQKRLAIVQNALQLEKRGPVLLQRVGKTYLDEAVKTLKESQLQDALAEQLQAFRDDMEPFAMEQLQRLEPQVRKMLLDQQDAVLTDLTEMLDDKINRRLAEMVVKYQDLLAQEGITFEPEKWEQMLRNVRTSAELAAESLIRKRIERNKQNFDRIINAFAALPPLPREMSERELIDDLTRALIARVKHELPDYEFE